MRDAPRPFSSLCQKQIRERAEAAFLGFALGDALGATLEFLTPIEIKARYGTLRDIQGGGWLRLPSGAVTDDTEMSLCVAHSLERHDFSALDIAERFAHWLRSGPRDVGDTCRRGIRRFLVDGSLCAPACDADGGNGAAMRMTPVALATLGDPERLVRCGLEQAHITHHHPLSDAACVLFGQLLQLAVLGHGKRCLEALAHDALRHYPQFVYRNQPVYSSAYVVDTFRTVLGSFFSTRGFEDCVITTVNHGGDADTTGAIAGALAGATFGPDELPHRWLGQLDPSVRREVTRSAQMLVERSPLWRADHEPKLAFQFLDPATRRDSCPNG